MIGSYFELCPKLPRSRKAHDPSSLLLLVGTTLDHVDGDHHAHLDVNVTRYFII